MADKIEMDEARKRGKARTAWVVSNCRFARG